MFYLSLLTGYLSAHYRHAYLIFTNISLPLCAPVVAIDSPILSFIVFSGKMHACLQPALLFPLLATQCLTGGWLRTKLALSCLSSIIKDPLYHHTFPAIWTGSSLVRCSPWRNSRNPYDTCDQSFYRNDAGRIETMCHFLVCSHSCSFMETASFWKKGKPWFHVPWCNFTRN